MIALSRKPTECLCFRNLSWGFLSPVKGLPKLKPANCSKTQKSHRKCIFLLRLEWENSGVYSNSNLNSWACKNVTNFLGKFRCAKCSNKGKSSLSMRKWKWAKKSGIRGAPSLKHQTLVYKNCDYELLFRVFIFLFFLFCRFWKKWDGKTRGKNKRTTAADNIRSWKMQLTFDDYICRTWAQLWAVLSLEHGVTGPEN